MSPRSSTPACTVRDCRFLELCLRCARSCLIRPHREGVPLPPCYMQVVVVSQVTHCFMCLLALVAPGVCADCWVLLG